MSRELACCFWWRARHRALCGVRRVLILYSLDSCDSDVIKESGADASARARTRTRSASASAVLKRPPHNARSIPVPLRKVRSAQITRAQSHHTTDAEPDAELALRSRVTRHTLLYFLHVRELYVICHCRTRY